MGFAAFEDVSFKYYGPSYNAFTRLSQAKKVFRRQGDAAYVSR